MGFTIGTLLAFSFAVSLIALAALIWAISRRQFNVTQRDAMMILPEGEEGKVDDPTSHASDGHAAPESPPMTREWRRLLLFMFISAIVWLLVGSAFGLIASLKLHLPDWLNGSPELTFGRVRTMHLNAVAYGWLSLAGIGTALWVLPTIFRTPLRHPTLILLGGLLWNVGVLAGLLAVASGWTEGLEWLEFPWQVDLVLAAGGAFLAVPLIMTAAARTVGHIYVTGWYLLAAMAWFPILFVLANLPGIHSGVQEATVNWWFAHNVLGLWLTPLGVGAAYYFIPKIIGKPIFSYRLSLIGFWGLALFYSQVGIHHLIGGPVPTWVVTLSVVQSVMMLIPVIAVAINQHVLWMRNLGAFRVSLPLRFIAIGALMYTFASVQGSLEALRVINTVTHFTHYTVGHAHLGAYAFVTLVMFGSFYYMLPRITGKSWPMPYLIGLHFWLVFLGFLIYFFALTIGGWLQGLAMLDGSRDWLESMQLTVPYLEARSIGGFMMVLGHLLFAVNVLSLILGRGARQGASQQDVRVTTEAGA
ncbi:cbb3-type cytochrome c oxidase subunit I [Halomonas korlensis]|uniref:Cytochrome c oxidase cbb3-type subunit 1 n=1 Tax=Halomonas korlensis TaxID=463301 RepID=A0A1I7IBI9_9GAMM|nr:cbb3-type cytochrome c oxidase subunit I [Halomonas korlensis]SFU70343.1 cytochrome c oxidase cbb3-type subunit 1 [Halomonas korlensis]